MSKNRLNAKMLLNKAILEEREDEIAKLKEELSNTHEIFTEKYEMLSDRHDMLTEEYDKFKMFHLYTVDNIKKELDENKEFTGNLMNKSTDIENTLYMKNAELVSRMEMMKEMNDKYNYMLCEMEKKIALSDAELLKRNDTICSLYNRTLAAEQNSKEMAIKLDYMNQTINALQNAATYMNQILYKK